jgi:hypothetical protein
MGDTRRTRVKVKTNMNTTATAMVKVSTKQQSPPVNQYSVLRYWLAHLGLVSGGGRNVGVGFPGPS